ncbi:hypothetical protein HUA74_28900 [Myxococcus sp. CA051A]|uniref:hypothetical protein n=1 Tax=Myxococcus sp. CA051A TaxID=2741739 RepID=UPI00157B59CD|nr:hypothetical protein [Myxococcus sp. CA051A]NTX64675.1 hypothetical protein [Myxococcus sp. CA051A]
MKIPLHRVVVHRAFAPGLLCVLVGLGCQAGGDDTAPPVRGQAVVASLDSPSSLPTSHHQIVFSASGPIDGMHCVAIDEPQDPNGWSDNYLCSPTDLGFVWVHADELPLPLMRCTPVTERSEPGSSWAENYLCIPHESPLTLTWSSAGPLLGKECVSFNEPQDPHGWSDNYLCLEAPLVMRFSASGPIEGMTCTLMNELADLAGGWGDNHLCTNKDIGLRWTMDGTLPAGARCNPIVESAEPAETTWHDNFLCVPEEAEAMFAFSSAGPLQGPDWRCTRLLETEDPHTWDDNYLCYREVPLGFQFSSAGPIQGKACTAITETTDVAGTWNDNFLCAERDVGLRWSETGAISGMRCTRIRMSGETGWDDNYLCVPPTSALNFVWSQMGRYANKISVPFAEPADPHANWMDAYLCY